MPTLLRRLVVLVGLSAVGVAVYVWLQQSAAAPKHRPPRERGRPVRVLAVQPMEVVPRATGYGVVQAQREWQAVTEVGGRVVAMAEGVEVGRTVPEGTILFKIDPGSYELEKTRTEATVRGVKAQIGEIKAREKSARASLTVEEKVRDMAQKDLERIQSLHQTGAASLLEVETAERAVLAAEKSVQTLENTLVELPASRRVLEATLEQQQVGVEGARIDLAKTEVVAPFTMRIREVSATLHQAVSAGQVVVIGDGIDAVEIPAQMPVGTIGPLLAPRPGGSPSASDPAEPTPGLPPRTGGRAAAIQAIVRLESQGVEAEWNGRFRRFQGVDPTTRTVGIVVEVDEPRRRQSGSGPPLSPGLHVEVELRGSPRAGCLAVPRTAVHQGKIHIADENERLELRDVVVDLLQEDYACISEGLAAGERVVLTELTPAVDGMLLAPRDDDTAAQWLAAAVRAEVQTP